MRLLPALSTLSSETAKGMSEKVKALNSTIASASQISEQSAQSDDRVVNDAGSTIQRVLLRYQEIMSTLSTCATSVGKTGVGISREINEVLVSLQFQDRTSQILAQVRDQLDGLFRRLQEGGASEADGDRPSDAQAWLAELEKGYTTQEQRDTHRGRHVAAAAGAGTGVTFF
jgi:methyl-accepting chemotaxis protein